MPLFAICLFILTFVSFSVVANDSVGNPGGGAPRQIPTTLPGAPDWAAIGRSQPGKNKAERELLCLRQRLIQQGDTNNLLGSEQAKVSIELTSEALQRSLDKFKMDNPEERALFYAQMIVESGGFRFMSETTNFSNKVTPQSAGDALIINEILRAEQDKSFNSGSGSSGYGIDRGYGPLQITGCDNQLSIIHFLNQFYRGVSEPQWNGYWWYPENGGQHQIDGTCSAEERSKMNRQYIQSRGYNANLYGAFADPARFGQIGGTLEDPVITSVQVQHMAPISSTEFMFDASLAYWKGRVGPITKDLSAKTLNHSQCFKDLYTSERDGKVGDTYLELANRCVTQKVRGLNIRTQRDLLNRSADERYKYVEAALQCMR